MVCFLAGELGLVWVNMFHGVPHTADDSERACLQRDNGGGCSSATIISMESTLFNVHPEVILVGRFWRLKGVYRKQVDYFCIIFGLQLGLNENRITLVDPDLVSRGDVTILVGISVVSTAKE
jgi:hypothetical protein